MPEAQSIGEAINMLRHEFPEISVSKLRFLEGKGLIDPGRSPSGYREFSPQDMERVRYILRQQRDHYLPLKVIKIDPKNKRVSCIPSSTRRRSGRRTTTTSC